MKKFIVMFLAVAAVFPIHAAAQGPATMIAYDLCVVDFNSEFTCYVNLQAVDGASPLAYIEHGTDPAWSGDGSRIAFVRDSQPSLFVLNLSDWSITSVHNTGESPAWSPDGVKLAFAAGELYVMSAGSNIVQLTNNVGFLGQPAWSQDGGTIAFDCEVESGNRDICAINTGGTDFRRLTFDPGWDSSAAFSPDGFTIAFQTTRYGYSQIALMNLDGTGISAVGGGHYGLQPAWSPDGNRIAFVRPFAGFCDGGATCLDSVLIMNRDGTGLEGIAGGNRPAFALAVRPVAWFYAQCNELVCAFDGSGSWGGSGGIMSYTWNFGDGTSGSGPKATHAYSEDGTYRVTLTVTDSAGISSTQNRDLNVAVNFSPTARLLYACYNGSECSFSAYGSSDPDGSIASYLWSFGDGTTGSGLEQYHTYTASGVYTVTLTVTDNEGASSTQSQALDIAVNSKPTASFTHTCVGPVCAFNGSGSSDPDGSIANYIWSFGDGTTGSGVMPSHMYAASGSYAVTLSVIDNGGASGFQTGSVTVSLPVIPIIHIGDLDRTRTNQQNSWTALVTITVHDGNHGPVANATVSGSWSIGGTGSCTTDGTGQCLIARSTIPQKTKNVTFSIVNVTKSNSLYGSVDSHDPDGDSNGTSITAGNR